MATTAKEAPAVEAVLAAAARLRGVQAEVSDHGTVTLTLKRRRVQLPYQALVTYGDVKVNGQVVGRLSMPTLTFTRGGRRTTFLGRADALTQLLLMPLY